MLRALGGGPGSAGKVGGEQKDVGETAPCKVRMRAAMGGFGRVRKPSGGRRGSAAAAHARSCPPVVGGDWSPRGALNGGRVVGKRAGLLRFHGEREEIVLGSSA